MTQDRTRPPVSQEFVGDVRQIIENGRQQAYAAASAISLATYWNIGQRIVEEEQKGSSRAEYGTRLIAGLAENLKNEYGSGYGKRNLAYFRQFYLLFNDIKILHEFVQNLTWTHIRRLMSVTDPVARQWYLVHASKDMWSTTTLDRNISSQYFERRLAEQRENPRTKLPEALCTDTDSTIARYSVLNDSHQLFAAKYMTYMPTEEELRHEIERQKRFFLEHHKND